MKIEVGKFYKTRVGTKVRIYALDGIGDFCIHGAVQMQEGWDDSAWNYSGKSIYDRCEDIISEWEENSYLPVKTSNLNYVEFPKNYIIKTLELQPQPKIVDDYLACLRYITAQQQYEISKNIQESLLIQMCNCGGKIDTHKPNCPENKAASESDDYYVNHYPERHLDNAEFPPPNEALKNLFKKCECGSETVGSSKHSEWCPRFERE